MAQTEKCKLDKLRVVAILLSLSLFSLVSPKVSLDCSGVASLMMSPNILNMSDQFKFLMPKSTSKNWSPLESVGINSPNLSPIAKRSVTPSDFLKRRDYPK